MDIHNYREVPEKSVVFVLGNRPTIWPINKKSIVIIAPKSNLEKILMLFNFSFNCWIIHFFVDFWSYYKKTICCSMTGSKFCFRSNLWFSFRSNFWFCFRSKHMPTSHSESQGSLNQGDTKSQSITQFFKVTQKSADVYLGLEM